MQVFEGLDIFQALVMLIPFGEPASIWLQRSYRELKRNWRNHHTPQFLMPNGILHTHPIFHRLYPDLIPAVTPKEHLRAFLYVHAWVSVQTIWILCLVGIALVLFTTPFRFLRVELSKFLVHRCQLECSDNLWYNTTWQCWEEWTHTCGSYAGGSRYLSISTQQAQEPKSITAKYNSRDTLIQRKDLTNVLNQTGNFFPVYALHNPNVFYRMYCVSHS